jgi:hypothetical protein
MNEFVAFDHIRGNFKGEWDDEVGPCTLWVGPNQAGKSSRIIGVRYALGGAGAWIAGQHGSQIAELAPADATSLYAELSGPSGSASFLVERKGAKWKDPSAPVLTGALAGLSDEERACCLPLLSTDALKLGRDRGPRLLIQRFSGGAAVPSPNQLLADQLVLWREVQAETQKVLLEKTGEEPTSAEVLAEMHKAFNRRKIAAGKRVSAAEQTLAARQAKLTDLAAGAEQLPQLRARLEALRLWEKTEAIRARQAALTQDKAAYQVRAEAFNGKAAAQEELPAPDLSAAADVAACRQRTAELTEQVEKLRQVLAAKTPMRALGQQILMLAQQVAGQCPVCGMAAQGPELVAYHQQWIAALEQEVAALTAQVTELGNQAQQSEARARQLEAQQQTALATRSRQREQRLRELEVERQWLLNEHARISTLEAELKKTLEGLGSQSPPSQTVAQLQLQIARCEEADKLQAFLDEDQRNLRTANRDKAMAADLEKEAKKLLLNFLTSVAASAEAAVDLELPEGLASSVDVETGTWRLLTRAGPKSKAALSGFELGALALAIPTAYAKPSRLRVLTLDDGDFAGLGTENVLRYFGFLFEATRTGRLTQVFAAGVRFEALVPAIRAIGWKVIEVG